MREPGTIAQLLKTGRYDGCTKFSATGGAERTQKFDQWFAPFQHRKINLLEMGIERKGSLRLWREYFTRAWIVGIDKNPYRDENRISCYQGRQEDPEFLTEVSTKHGPWSIVIDDAAHLGAYARTSFDVLFGSYLASGGIYIIEDWGTAYLPTWRDGQQFTISPHMAGMAGLIHELVDGIGLDSHPIASMEVCHGAVTLVRA